MSIYSDKTFVPAEFEFETESEDEDLATTSRMYPFFRSSYLSETGMPLLNLQQKQQIMNYVNEIDPEMKQKLIVQYRRMVVSIAKRYSNRGLALVELIHMGNQGLIQALETLESEAGLRFSSRIVKSIYQYIEGSLLSWKLNDLPSPLQSTAMTDKSINKVFH
jgi:DNA-directed RNA polymerase sigma subunit (sigma70/sigma32)